MSVSFLIVAFVIILVISGVFSMFGKGGGSLYTPVLVMLGMAAGRNQKCESAQLSKEAASEWFGTKVKQRRPQRSWGSYTVSDPVGSVCPVNGWRDGSAP